MDYSKLVPSRELCEEMARLGICQDDKSMAWIFDYGKWRCVFPYRDYTHDYTDIIAPTLPRMMEELPIDSKITKILIQIRGLSGWHEVYLIDDYNPNNQMAEKYDALLANAVAKVLIAIKKGK